jgi:hypothetical protein
MNTAALKTLENPETCTVKLTTPVIYENEYFRCWNKNRLLRPSMEVCTGSRKLYFNTKEVTQ